MLFWQPATPMPVMHTANCNKNGCASECATRAIHPAEQVRPIASTAKGLNRSMNRPMAIAPMTPPTLNPTVVQIDVCISSPASRSSDGVQLNRNNRISRFMNCAIHSRIVIAVRPSRNRWLTVRPASRGSRTMKRAAASKFLPGSTRLSVCAIRAESPFLRTRNGSDSGSHSASGMRASSGIAPPT